MTAANDWKPCSPLASNSSSASDVPIRLSNRHKASVNINRKTHYYGLLALQLALQSGQALPFSKFKILST